MRNLTDSEWKALESIPVTPEQVAEFMAECDAGLHPLTEADEKSLERSRELLMSQLKAINHSLK